MSDQIIRFQFVDRRMALAGGLAMLGGGIACARQPEADAAVQTAEAGGACRLYPQQTEGPYYFDPKLQRADLTEGKPGSPLDLVITVLGADCRPLEGARVDIWHCDAQGTYSGFAGAGQANAEGEVFLRGWLPTAANGEAAFRTVYPGWYPGRTTHIHLKVILADNSVLTSQLYFPESLNEEVYRQAAYRRGGARDTHNADDGIFGDGGAQTMATIAPSGAGHVARLTVAVDPAARPAERGGPGGRRGRRGPPPPI